MISANHIWFHVQTIYDFISNHIWFHFQTIYVRYMISRSNHIWFCSNHIWFDEIIYDLSFKSYTCSNHIWFHWDHIWRHIYDLKSNHIWFENEIIYVFTEIIYDDTYMIWNQTIYDLKLKSYMFWVSNHIHAVGIWSHIWV